MENMKAQLHKRFGKDKVKAISRNDDNVPMSRVHARELSGLSRTRFFAILRSYRAGQASFYQSMDRKSAG